MSLASPKRNRTIQPALVFAILMLAWGAPAVAAPACSVPASGDWTIDADCDLAIDEIAPRNVTIEPEATLRITASGSLNIDLLQFRLRIADSARLLIDDGGRLYSFPVGQLLKTNTDGQFGYYLKRVDGGVLAAFNANFAFYPASTNKVMQHLHALRAVEAGTVTLAGTTLTVCSGGTNCTNNANTLGNCGGATVIETLSQALQNMMGPSNNQSTNAVQELFGNGNPQTGRTAINQTATNIVGMSNATVLQHKFNCGNVNNNPFNTLTLQDGGLLYEQVATNAAVLLPATRTLFYQLMQNQTNNRYVDPVATTEAGNIGMSAADLASFLAMVQMAHKAGNIGTSYQSIVGWISLPVNGGSGVRDYVYGFFVHNANTNTLPNIRAVANVLLRGVIRSALDTW